MGSLHYEHSLDTPNNVLRLSQAFCLLSLYSTAFEGIQELHAIVNERERVTSSVHGLLSVCIWNISRKERIQVSFSSIPYCRLFQACPETCKPCPGVQAPFQSGQWGQTAHCPKHTTDRSVMMDRSISGSFEHRSIHGDGSIDLRFL